MKEGGGGGGGVSEIDLFRLKFFIRSFPVAQMVVYRKSGLLHFYKGNYVHFAVQHKHSGFFQL